LALPELLGLAGDFLTLPCLSSSGLDSSLDSPSFYDMSRFNRSSASLVFFVASFLLSM
jgi:hypothetical protein